MTNQVIQMKISLDYTEPEIWRRFVVDSSFTLQKLHDVIQVVMGWENYHLYSFIINKIDYQVPDDFGEDLFKSMGAGPKPQNVKKAKLSDLNLRSRQKMRYTYDFGDNWEHTILIEKINEANDDTLIPYCIEGERSCPPEDCGSIPGYEDILEALKNPKLKKNSELLEWVGEDYDPNVFDVKKVNDELKPKKAIKKKGK